MQRSVRSGGIAAHLFACTLLAASSSFAISQMAAPAKPAAPAEAATKPAVVHIPPAEDYGRLLGVIEGEFVSAAEAMPEDKFNFAPPAGSGNFHGVRTFGQQVKHLAATNNILAAAALGEEAPADAGDEAGPETVRTKAEILDYLKDSFAHLGRAVAAIGDARVPVRPSPISPLGANSVTRIALITEALVHSFDHYGQMVEYLRMNGLVPPASAK